jgi:UDP-glucose 4-epimerase
LQSVARCVVTGGAGFIGSHIVRRLLADGHEACVVDDLSTGHRENLAEVADSIELLDGSVCDRALLLRAMEGAQWVFHQAALASVQRSVDDPVASNRINVEGTLQVLAAARSCGVRRVVFASSSSVYGDAPALPKREDMTPAPKSPYAITKLAGEHYCAVYHELFGLETVSLRYFNVFGPHQDPRSQYAAVIPLFVSTLMAGRGPTVFGDGEQSRDFTYVENVAEANIRAAQAPGAPGGVFNVGCGTRYSLNDLLAMLGRILGLRVRPVYADPRPGDVRDSLADISRARQVLGFEPIVGFEEGLRRTVEWYKARAEASR